MKIYVTCDSGHCMQDALQHGDDLIYITGKKPGIFKTDGLIEQIKNVLEGFEKDDYILFTGNSVVCGLSLAILFTRYSKIKMLIYNNKSTEYVPRTIEKAKLERREDDKKSSKED